MFPSFPFGTDFTPEELVLGKVLKGLKGKLADTKGLVDLILNTVAPPLEIPDAAKPYLERLRLDRPAGLEEQMLQRVLLGELAAGGYL